MRVRGAQKPCTMAPDEKCGERMAMGQGVVRVASTTRRKFAPDVARVSVSIGGEHDTKEACTEEFNERYGRVCEALIGAGVAAEAITTENFAVHMRQESLYLPYEHGGGYYWCKNVPDGYEYDGRLSVKLAADADLVGRVWVALSDCGEGITFRISYDVDDRDAAEQALMEDAVREALLKARTLARGAGKELGEVRAINFGTDFSEFDMPREYGVLEARAMKCMSADAGGGAPSLQPRDIEIACEVSIECELL